MSQSWQTIRVFISSTFRDMHAERDYLVQRVFPALRERLEKYRVHLVDIDLRWGITEEQSDSDQALDLCLQQIDECPLFIGLLGERYGFVPKRISKNITSLYGWIQQHTGKSITELEMLHGVLHNKEMRPYSYFYFRDPKFIADVHDSKRADMEAEDAESAEKLRKLKKEILGADLPVRPVENYPCEYAGLRINRRLLRKKLLEQETEILRGILEDGIVDYQEYKALNQRLRDVVDQQGSVHLKGLEEFGSKVSEHLWAGIQAKLDLPDTPPSENLIKPDPLAEEQDYHERFIEQRLRVHVPRQVIQDKFQQYLKGNSVIPLLVTGASGSGKSATLARFARDYEDMYPGSVIAHFVGASPASTNLNQMLTRFCEILKQRFDFEEDIPFESNKLSTLFLEFIEKVPENQFILLVIDALNQLDDTNNAHALNWLPRELTASVKIVTSCIINIEVKEKVLTSFESREHESLVIDPLTDTERRQIIHDVPSLSAKTLDKIQVELLLENPATCNPLFLLVALEELRGFGSYEQLSRRIEELPREGDTVTSIFGQVLHRMEEEYNTKLVQRALSLLGCSRSGLSQHEILELIEKIGVKTDGSVSDLFPVLRQLRPYLQDRGELIDFHHQNLAKAVVSEMSYLAQERVTKTVHREIAEYFWMKADPTRKYLWDSDNRRGLSELVYHLSNGEMAGKVHKVLTDIRFIEKKILLFNPQHLVDDFNLVLINNSTVGKLLDVEQVYLLRTINEAIILSANILTLEPLQVRTQVYGRLMSNPEPSVSKLCNKVRKDFDLPWLRPLMSSLLQADGSLKRSLEGHTKMVHAITYFSEGKKLISASDDGTLRVWDLETGEVLKVLCREDCEDGYFKDVVVTQDDRFAVSVAGYPSTLDIWNLDTGQITKTLSSPHCEYFRAVAVFPGGKKAITVGDSISLWDLENGCLFSTYKPPSDDNHTYNDVSISSTGQQVIIASHRFNIEGDDNDEEATFQHFYAVEVWDLEEGVLLRTLIGHSSDINAIAMLSDDQRALSCSTDGTLRLWNIETGVQLCIFESHLGQIDDVSVSADGSFALATSDRFLLKWDLETGVLTETLEGHSNIAIAVNIRYDQTEAVSSGLGKNNYFTPDFALKVWDLKNKVNHNQYYCHAAAVQFISAFPDGSAIVSASSDKTLKVWNLHNREEIMTLTGHTMAVVKVHVLPDGEHAISGSLDRTLKLWDLNTGGVLNTLEGHTAAIQDVRVYQEGRRAISVAEGGELKVWNLVSGKELYELVGHTGDINDISISFNETRIVTGGDDGILCVWDIEAGVEVQRIDVDIGEIATVCTSLDGQRVAVTAFDPDPVLKIFDMNSGQLIKTIPYGTSITSLLDGKHAVYATCVEPVIGWDRQFTSAGVNGNLSILDWETGRDLYSFTGEAGLVYSLRALSDNQHIISTSFDGRIKIWSLHTRQFITSFTGNGMLSPPTEMQDHLFVIAEATGRIHFLQFEELNRIKE